MSIRLHVEVCKKEGTANYGSIGATCGLEVEIDQSDLSDPVAAAARIRGYYSFCELAMNEELGRLRNGNGNGNTTNRPAADPPPPAQPVPDRQPVVTADRRGPAAAAEEMHEYETQEEPDEDDEDDPPTDGKHLLGWARNQPGDAKGWLIGLGKKLRYPNRILDWTPRQVETAYQAYKKEQRRKK